MSAADISAAYEAALAHQRAGRLPEAEALYRQILQAAPNHADTLHMMGALALQAGRPDLAAGWVERAIGVDPRQALYHVTLGQAWLQLGKEDNALHFFRAATTLEPDSAVAHFLTGVVLRQKARLGEACAAFETALRFQPQFVQALFNLGAILQDEGRRREAEARYRRVLVLAPDFVEAHINLGICLVQEGQLQAALPHFERAAALQPQSAGTHANLGNALLELGDPERAVASFRRALELEPRAAELHFGLGNAFRAQDRLEAALAAYRDALGADANFLGALVNVGGVCSELGRAADAERYFRRAAASAPDWALAHVGLSFVLEAQDKSEEALAEAERAVALDPALPDAQTALGLSLLASGKRDEAAAAFRRALDKAPEFPAALAKLAEIEGAEAAAPLIPRIEGALASPRQSPGRRTGLLFALGRLQDRSGDYGKAFSSIKQANDLRAARQPFDLPSLERQIDALTATFDRAFFAMRRDIGSDSERPIFIAGMPRAGLALVEQILAKHPLMHAAGAGIALDGVIEALNRFPPAASAGKAYPEAAAFLDRESTLPLAQRYLDEIASRAGDAARVTIRRPTDFLHLGLIALLFPRAAIIHCRRDPFDTCLSCYFHDFERPQPFTNTLERLGHYYREYERLMAHWRAVLPAPMLEVSFEALVTEPEASIRRILDHCGLPWEARLQESIHQIHGNSVGRWRHYREQLRPLFDALGRAPDANAAS